jgi:hypothetical protein
MHDLLIIRNGCSITDDTKLFAQCLIGLRHRHAEHMDYHVTGLGVPDSVAVIQNISARFVITNNSPHHTSLLPSTHGSGHAKLPGNFAHALVHMV